MSLNKVMGKLQDQPFFSLVILCFGSGKGVIPVVKRVHNMLSQLVTSWEIILVGNYFEDGEGKTREVVIQLEQELMNVRAITLPKRGMMGWDMRKGFEACRGNFIGIIDGDGQFPLESIMSCYFRAIEGDVDMVKTYRTVRKDGIMRIIISFCYNLIVRILFSGLPFRDLNSKPKIFTRNFYERLKLQDDGWFIDAEIMLKANLFHAKIYEMPIHFYNLANRHSFVKFTAMWEFIRKLISFRLNVDKIRSQLMNEVRK